MSEQTAGHRSDALPEAIRSPSRTVLFGTALTAVTVGPLLPRVVVDALLGYVPTWVWLAQFAVGAGLVVLAFFTEGFRPLRSLAVALIAVQVTRLYFEVGTTPDALFGVRLASPWAETLLDESIQLSVALGALVLLFALGYRRDDLLLQSGTLSNPLEPVRIPGLHTEQSWRRAGLVVGGWLVGPLVAVLLLGGVTYEFTAYDPETLAVLVPAILVAAAMNAFTEEAVFRAIPAAELAEALGKSRALLVMAAFFGLAHYYGTPGGPLGVLMTGFLAWMLAKSMLETRGIAVAFLVHWILDIVIVAAFLT